ncbi:hypothetical protein Plhal703r1_c23g0099081 [Plasmopara halstedii]
MMTLGAALNIKMDWYLSGVLLLFRLRIILNSIELHAGVHVYKIRYNVFCL